MHDLLNGKYILDRRLGGGGMAEVFLAHTVGAEGFKRAVAIKRVLAGFSNDPRFAQMFVTEAQLSSRLQHPNIVNVLDFDRGADGHLYLVMELVDGATLDELAATGVLPFGAIAYVIGEVLRGLGYAHDLPAASDGVRGVVHRDISPHNVLLSWEGSVKVSDFGLAKARAATSVTASDTIKGKPAYMSPEQANGEDLDGRSDLFAAGVVLWELLCGRPLFSGATTHETLARLMFAPIPSPRDLRPDVSRDLERVTTQLLARRREDRYATAQAALGELVACADYPRAGRELMVALLAERFTDRAPQRVHPMSDVPPASRLRTTVHDLPRPLDGRPPSRNRFRWLFVVAIVSTAALGATLWLTTRSGTPARPDAMTAAVAATVDAAMVDAAIADAEVVDAAADVADAKPKRRAVDELAPAKPPKTVHTVSEEPDEAAMEAATQKVKTLAYKHCPTWYSGVNAEVFIEISASGIVTKVGDVSPPDLKPCLAKVVRAVNFPVSSSGDRVILHLGNGITERP